MEFDGALAGIQTEKLNRINRSAASERNVLAYSIGFVRDHYEELAEVFSDGDMREEDVTKHVYERTKETLDWLCGYASGRIQNVSTQDIPRLPALLLGWVRADGVADQKKHTDRLAFTEEGSKVLQDYQDVKRLKKIVELGDLGESDYSEPGRP